MAMLKSVSRGALAVGLLLVTGPVALAIEPTDQRRGRLASSTEPARAGDLAMHGVVLSPQRIELRSDISAAIAEVRHREGDTFKSGDLLLRFDCAREAAELAAARARRQAAHVELGQARHLHSLGASGTGEVRTASARAEAAGAEARVSEARMSDCRIEAPFDGRVAELKARAHAHAERGAPLMVLIGRSRLEVEFVAPSRALRTVGEGSAFTFVVDETGAAMPGIIERTGAEVDTASRTIKLYGRLSGNTASVLSGMSGVGWFGATE